MLNWKKSSKSGAEGNCVEVALEPGHAYLRHSKHPNGDVLEFDQAAFADFLQGVKNGEFDRA